MITTDFLISNFIPLFCLGFWGFGLVFFLVALFIYKVIFKPAYDEYINELEKRKNRDDMLDDLIDDVDDLKEILLYNSKEVEVNVD